MAFPTTPVLDDFNAGASQALTARSGWASSMIGVNSWSTDGTPTKAVFSTTNAGNDWNASSVDTESYVKLANFNPTNDTFEICARVTGTGGNPTYYAVGVGIVGLTDFQIVKCVSNIVTAIGTNVPTTISNGDSVGISVVATTITSWYKSGAGAWVQKDSITDSAISGSGFFGFRSQFGTSTTLDDFGGGAPVAQATSRAELTVRRLVRSGA